MRLLQILHILHRALLISGEYREGIDLTSGRPPSAMQLFRLASNRKFNREIKSVMEELEAAGLNVFSEVSAMFSINTSY